MQSSLRISKPLFFLCSFFLIMQFFNGYNAAQTGYLGAANFGYSLAFYWVIGWWFINDSRKHGIKWVDDYMDMGMFLYIAWIFILPYYLFKTRGWKAIYTIGLLLAVYFGAYLLGMLLYLLLGLF